MIAGIDFSTHAVDVVLLDEDTDAATWHRFELEGADAFARTRDVGSKVPRGAFWDDVLAVGIEAPRGPNKNTLLPIQGAILAALPRGIVVDDFVPSQWRKAVGLPGNASKADVELFVDEKRHPVWPHREEMWPQDACDAYCIALATRSKIRVTKPPPLPTIAPASTDDPTEIARIILAGGAFTDEDARRLADAYLWLIDDGAAA